MQSLNLKNIKSSYAENNYGDVFYYVVKAFKPKTVVELGSLQGYSAIHIVSALKEQSYNSRFVSIDLHDKYIWNHSTKKVLENNLKKNSLLNLSNVNVELVQADAFKYVDKFDDNSVDLLHIDISNNGDMLEKCFNKWHKKLKTFGIVMFEGGSDERDYIDWMIRYRKVKIGHFINSCFFRSKYKHMILNLFPSLTIAQKVRK